MARRRITATICVAMIAVGSLLAPVSAFAANVIVSDGSIVAPPDVPADTFARAVDVDGDTAVFGTPGETIDSRHYIGAYVATRSGSGWGSLASLEVSYVTPPNVPYVGSSVAISGDTIVLGAGYEDVPDAAHPGNNLSHAGAVYVFVKSGSSWVLQQRLTAPVPTEREQFGGSVAVDGDTIVVGASGEEEPPIDGSAYVFDRSGSSWTWTTTLVAPHGDGRDAFGNDLAIDGDTIVVGAYREDGAATGVAGDQTDNSAQDSGAAYIFQRTSENWDPTPVYLKPSNTNTNFFFGSSVDVSGNTVAVGAPGETSAATGIGGDDHDTSATGAGAVYVFVHGPSTWTQQAYVKASNTGASDDFGGPVSLDGDVLVVGADGEDSDATGVGGSQSNNSLSDSGAAYVFARTSATWTQTAYLKSEDPNQGGSFGHVSVSGPEILVGAPEEWFSPDNHARVGAIHSFRAISDAVRPVTSGVRIGVRAGAKATGLPALVTWSASDNTSASWQLRNDVDVRHHKSSGWSSWQSLARGVEGTTLGAQLSFGTQYEVRVRTHDAAGNVGAWVVSAPTTAKVRQESAFTLSRHWTSSWDPQAMGKHVAYSSSVGANARLTFTGVGVAAVLPTGKPSNREAKVCLDKGTAHENCRTVDLTSPPAQTRSVVSVFDGLGPGTHTLDITVKSGLVILDAAIVWK